MTFDFLTLDCQELSANCQRLNMLSLKIRLKIIYFGFFAVALLIAGRFFYLQAVQYSYFQTKSQNMSEKKETILTNRGEIFMQDKNGELFPLAQNKDWFSLYAVPKEMNEPRKAAEELSAILNIDKETISKKLSVKNDPYEMIKRKITDEETEKIKNLKYKGIYLEKQYGRYYPNNELSSHLVGFLSIKDDKVAGQYGIEEYFNKELSGEEGKAIVSKDVFGNWISIIEKKIFFAPEPSHDLILTIDPNIQTKAEEELKKLVEERNAQGGTIIVMNPKDGAILAMTSNPNFDPNNYQNVKDIGVFLNPATQSVYEPGSAFKPITFAAALQENVITPDTTYTDYGFIKFGSKIIKNYDNHVYGESTMTKVLEYSINTGAIFAASRLSNEKFFEYVEKFGFNKKTGIELFETVGNISNLKTKININYATASFGQGIAVTPIELITAVSAIANNGKMSKPYLVKKMISSEGSAVEHRAKDGNQIISSKTALTLTTMMKSVIDNGAGAPAKIHGYSIAGKTGTAQIPDYKKGGYTNEYIHSFVGFAPAIDPKFSILIKLDKPQGARAASITAAPAFKNLAEYILNYYEIPPDQL